MPLLAALQAEIPGWVPPTIAISLVLQAIATVTVLYFLAITLKQLGETADKLEKILEDIHGETGPVLRAVKEAAGAAKDITTKVEEETKAVIRTSQRIRHDVERGVRRARRRLSDLDALVEVVQGEVEETALDVAATLRTVRKGRGVMGRLRRLVRGAR